MGVIKLFNLTSTTEVSAIVKGFLAFEGIEQDLYFEPSMLYGEHYGEWSQPRCTPRFRWQIFFPRRIHNTAFITQESKESGRESKTAMGVYNDSLVGFSGRPEEVPRAHVRNTHFFQQWNSIDCGFCAAFFVIHAVKFFEREFKAGNVPRIDQLPEPPYNPFARASSRREVVDSAVDGKVEVGQAGATARLQAAFYANCFRMHPDAGGNTCYELNIPSDAKNYASDAGTMDTGHVLFREFFREHQPQAAGLTEAKFLQFIRENLPRNPDEVDFSDWFLYQNIMLYLLLNHFSDVCKIIRQNPARLSIAGISVLEVQGEGIAPSLGDEEKKQDSVDPISAETKDEQTKSDKLPPMKLFYQGVAKALGLAISNTASSGILGGQINESEVEEKSADSMAIPFIAGGLTALATVGLFAYSAAAHENVALSWGFLAQWCAAMPVWGWAIMLVGCVGVGLLAKEIYKKCREDDSFSLSVEKAGKLVGLW